MCGYFGTVVDTETAEQREEEHEARNYPPAIYRLGGGKCLDPYVWQGQLLTPEDNPGVWVNHSRRTASAKVLSVMKDNNLVCLLVVAVRDISEGEQLFQDYNERGPDAPDWMNELLCC